LSCNINFKYCNVLEPDVFVNDYPLTQDKMESIYIRHITNTLGSITMNGLIEMKWISVLNFCNWKSVYGQMFCEILHRDLKGPKDAFVDYWASDVFNNCDPNTLLDIVPNERPEVSDEIIEISREKSGDGMKKKIEKFGDDTKHNIEKSADGVSCPICYENIPDMAYFPCRHMVCHSCYDRLPRRNCPVCRTDISRSLKMFLS